MDISPLSALQQNPAQAAIQVAVLKKTIAVEAQAALALLGALPQPTAVSPPHLGRQVNTTA